MNNILTNLGSVDLGNLRLENGSSVTFNHPIIGDYTKTGYTVNRLFNEVNAQINFGSNLTLYQVTDILNLFA